LKNRIFLLLLLIFGCSSPRTYSIISPEDTASPSKGETKFSLEVNPRVQKEIDAIVANPESKKEFKEAVLRMSGYRMLVEPILVQAHLPLELLAVPLVQTGYINRVPKDDEDGAGIWRFTPFTANMYGLITNDPSEEPASSTMDDRLDVQKETRAAAAYFEHLYDLYHDWRLVLMAYCEGEGMTSEKLGQRPGANPWVVDSMMPDEKSCLAQTMAVLYLLRHPETNK